MSTLPLAAITAVSPVSAATPSSGVSMVASAQAAGAPGSASPQQQAQFEALMQEPGPAGVMAMPPPVFAPPMPMSYPKLILDKDDAEDEEK